MGRSDLPADQLNDLRREMAVIAGVVQKIYDLMISKNFEIDSNPEPKTENKSSSVSKPDEVLARFARKLSLGRRDRDNAVAAGLFHDPAWDILLDVFIAHAQGKSISITSASLSSNVSESTAIRWIWALEKSGLLKREPDRIDKRRTFVLLTDVGLVYMRQVLNSFSNRMDSPFSID
jgi:predicted transcriptional regulator